MWCVEATKELKTLLANEQKMSAKEIDEYLSDAWIIRYNENGDIDVKWEPDISDNFFDILNNEPKTKTQRYLEARERRRNIKRRRKQ